MAEPTALAGYVPVNVVGLLVAALPARAGLAPTPPAHRLRGVYEALAGCGIVADPEPGPERPEIRPAEQVLAPPGRANRLDLAVLFAGACLDAGLHPVVVLLESADGADRRALVAVWLRGDWAGPSGTEPPYPFADPVLTAPPAWPAGGFAPVDVAGLTSDRASSYVEAVAAGAALLDDPQWSWTVGVDIGLLLDPRDLPASPYGSRELAAPEPTGAV